MIIESKKLSKAILDLVEETRKHPRHPVDKPCEACLIKRALFDTREARMLAESIFRVMQSDDGGVMSANLLEVIAIGFDLALRYIENEKKGSKVN